MISLHLGLKTVHVCVHHIRRKCYNGTENGPLSDKVEKMYDGVA